MTFKHVKFEDSPVMRSLERVAQERGMIKADPLQKTAAVKKTGTSLVPSTSLLDNVVRLCAGLRERGFEKQAVDLEVHFAQYKQAQTLYETHKEEGKDVIEFAHPEGSHKLEDVDSDEAVFEDILDQMSKTLEKVEKKPTGKLTEAERAIATVKTILGQAASESDSLEAKIIANVNQVTEILNRISQRVKSEMTFGTDFDWNANPVKELAKNPTLDNLNKMKSDLQALKERIEPGIVSGITQDTWDSFAGPLVGRAQQLVNQAIPWRQRVNEIAGQKELGDYRDAGPQEGTLQVPEVEIKGRKDMGAVQSQIEAATTKLNAFQNVVDSNPRFASNPQAKNTATKFIRDTLAQLQRQSKALEVPDNQIDYVLPSVRKTVSSILNDVNEFGSTWLGIGA